MRESRQYNYYNRHFNREEKAEEVKKLHLEYIKKLKERQGDKKRVEYIVGKTVEM